MAINAVEGVEPPEALCRSRMIDSLPAKARRIPEASPAMPAPIMTHSKCLPFNLESLGETLFSGRRVTNRWGWT